MKVTRKFNKIFFGGLVLLICLYSLGYNVFARSLLSEADIARSIHTLPYQAAANHNYVVFHNSFSHDEYAGVYLDDEILVIMALTHPDDAHINSFERIKVALQNDARILHDYVRIEEARFSVSEQEMVQDYLDQFFGDIIYSTGSTVISNNINVGLAYYIYDNEELRNETKEFLRERISKLSHKEDFSEILTFSRCQGFIYYRDVDYIKGLFMYQYEEIDGYSTLTIQPGRTRIGSAPSRFHATANNSMGNGEYLISTGHAFNIGDSVWLGSSGHTHLGTVVDRVIFRRVDASLIKLNPNVEVSTFWPDSQIINSNTQWVSLVGDSITMFGATQHNNNGNRGTITETNRRLISPTAGIELGLVEATPMSNPGVIVGTSPQNNRIVFSDIVWVLGELRDQTT